MPTTYSTNPLRGMSPAEVLESLRIFEARLQGGVYHCADERAMLEAAVAQLGDMANGLSGGSVALPITPVAVEQVIEYEAVRAPKRKWPKPPPFPTCDMPSQALSEMDFDALVNEIPVGRIDPPVDSRSCFLAGDLCVPTATGYVAGLSLSEYEYGRRIAYSPDPTPEEQVFTIEYPNLTGRPRLAVPLGALAHLQVEGNELRPPTLTDPAVWATARPFKKLAYTVTKAPDDHPLRFLAPEAVIQLVPSTSEQKFWAAVLPIPDTLRNRGNLAAKEQKWDEVFDLVSSIMVASDWKTGGTNFQYVCHPRFGKFLNEHRTHLPLIISTTRRVHCHGLAWWAAGQLRSFGVPAWISLDAVVTQDGKHFNGSMLHARTVFCSRLNGEIRAFCPSSRVSMDQGFHPDCLDSRLVDQLDQTFRKVKTDRGRVAALNEFMGQVNARWEAQRATTGGAGLTFGGWGLRSAENGRDGRGLLKFSEDKATRSAVRRALSEGEFSTSLAELRSMFNRLAWSAIASDGLRVTKGEIFSSGRDTAAERESFNAVYALARTMRLPVPFPKVLDANYGDKSESRNLPFEKCIFNPGHALKSQYRLLSAMMFGTESWLHLKRVLEESEKRPPELETRLTVSDLLIKEVIAGESIVLMSPGAPIPNLPLVSAAAKNSLNILAQTEFSTTGLTILRAGYRIAPHLFALDGGYGDGQCVDAAGELVEINHSDLSMPDVMLYREQLRDYLLATYLFQSDAPKSWAAYAQVKDCLGKIRRRAALNCEYASRASFFNPTNDPLVRFIDHRQTRPLAEIPECSDLKGALTELNRNLTLPPDQQAQLRTAFERALRGLDRFQAHSRDDDDRQPRSYTPGDDARLVDWNLYGRSDQLVVRAPQGKAVGLRSPIHVLVDTALLDDPFMVLRLVELTHVLQLNARVTGREVLIGASGMNSSTGFPSSQEGIVARPSFGKINNYKGSPVSILSRIHRVWQDDFRLAGGLPLINGVAPKTILFVSDNYTRICCMKRLLPGASVTGLYLGALEFNIYPVCPPRVDFNKEPKKPLT